MAIDTAPRIVSPIPETCRDEAVTLYWIAFRGKLGRILGPETRARAFLARVMRMDFGIGALGQEGQLLGLAGYKTAQGALVGGELSDLTAIYGRFGGLWRGVFLSTLERPVAKDILLMDGIAVSPDARGRGVGTALLDAIKAHASDLGKPRIRLDVIDTNPRAAKLYLRAGFKPGRTSSTWPLGGILGFSSATEMQFSTGANSAANQPKSGPDPA